MPKTLTDEQLRAVAADSILITFGAAWTAVMCLANLMRAHEEAVEIRKICERVMRRYARTCGVEHHIPGEAPVLGTAGPAQIVELIKRGAGL